MPSDAALIIAPAWVGDAVMAEPLLARLQAQRPERALDVYAPPWVAPVFARMREVRAVHVNPVKHGQLALKLRWQEGRRLAACAYQAAWVLPNSLKSALPAFFAGIPQRVGFTGEARYGLLNVRHVLDKSALPLMVERFAQLAEPPGTPLPRPVAHPRLQSSPAQQAATLAALASEKPEKLAVFCPGAEYGPAKRWPPAHFAALADALAGRGYVIWLMGSNKDHPVGQAICAAAQTTTPVHNLCGRTRLDQAIDLMALADVVVTNDSGLMHVAAAVDRPLIALFGSSSPGFTPPLSERAEVLSLGLSCSPCFRRECPLGHLDCLVQLTPEQVWQRLSARLQE